MGFNIKRKSLKLLAVSAWFICALPALAGKGDVVVGNVRVQFLSKSLVRLEQKGPKGFEDRATFTVVQRRWPGVEWMAGIVDNDRYIDYITRAYTVRILDGGKSIQGAQVVAPNGAILFEYKDAPPKDAYFPAPSSVFGAYAMADSPRIVPPSWGATPPPLDSALPTSGWDLDNDAPDVYVFVNSGGGYTGLRKDFLRLTGPVPMPPLFMFGFIDSRYHPYTSGEALAAIDTYRAKRIPLDAFVVDTDWRKGGSHGYAVEDKLFPDMAAFIDEAHKRHVRLMYNDHPEPVAPTATDPKELQFRWEGLTSLMKLGMDVWWYDRNWGTHIATPAEGLPLEVWGMRVYADMTQRFRPDRRPVIMSNVWGIDNGFRNRPTHPAAHRYPVWWTGDTQSRWQFLKMGVANGVDSGVLSMLPYVNEDLGGHWGGPTPELYVRFLQFGCLSPITRIHCTRGEIRYPWAFGPEAEKIVPEYIKLRYRLLPTIYAAARRTYDDGTPLMRRCDLYWPTIKQAADSSQYLLGDDILVAPVTTGMDDEVKPIPEALLSSGPSRGLQAEYYSNAKLEGEPTLVRTDRNVDFGWARGKPMDGVGPQNFSVRWSGKIGPMPETGSYTFRTRTDDGVRLWVDGKLLVDSWVPQAGIAHSATVDLAKAKSYDIRLEYFQLGGDDLCKLGWLRPSEKGRQVRRSVWIPPGRWQDLWNGRVWSGPSTITVESPLWHLPLFVRVGGLVILGPEMQYTGQEPWSRLVAEAFVPDGDRSTTRELYEDDGTTNAYKDRDGVYARTPLKMSRKGDEVRLVVGPMRLSRGLAAVEKVPVSWKMRLHLPEGKRAARILIDGKPIGGWKTVKPGAVRGGMGMLPFGAAVRPLAFGGSIVELSLPAARGSTKRVVTVQMK